MKRRFFFLPLLLLVATAASAQTADIYVQIGARITPTVDANRLFTWDVNVGNVGPDPARYVTITAWTIPPLPTSCSPAVIDAIAPASQGTFQCVTNPNGFAGFIELLAHASAATNDPSPSNDAYDVVKAISGADLELAVATPTIDPGLPFDVGLYYFNGSIDVPASNVTATVTLPPQVHVVKLPDQCTQSGQVVTCAAGTVPPNKLDFQNPDTTFTAVADDSTNGQVLHIMGDISTPDPEGNLSNNHYDDSARVFRTFFVTNTAPGALGAAIDQANLNCTDEYPCRVAFRLGTPPASGYFTLKPVNALPKITGKLISIDGTTQTRLTGDTNPDGPEVFIDGSDSTWEDALAVDEPCAADIAGLAIGNFKNAAVTVSGELTADNRLPCNSFLPRTVHDNYLGVDPTGTQPAPNGRGVVINDRLFAAVATKVTNNVISANRRSGIWIGRAAGESISGNRIGLDIHNQPLGNGASGIYAGPNVFDLDIRGNYIAFNHDFGIAVDRNAIGVDVGPNSIFANAQLGIDVGLDGPTPGRDIPAPVVLSAQYDPATNTTVLTIASHEPPNVILPTLIMYASDAPHPSGYGDGQYYLGSLRFNSSDGNIRFAATGDWRGKWVSATVTRNNFFGFLRVNAVQPNAEFPDTHSSTSEFSRAVEVE
ncbi:MAG TPA: right-handed parallel beta-helix repeat-containing protein [Thermoanaerobaculia bacterium]|nr:right-handed parallel beta-helix repeat-containing protein [Thermoanaerobaculia bacterium]